MTGSLDVICDSPFTVIDMIADCGGSNPEVACACCERCCQDGINCHQDDGFLSNYASQWQQNYRRFDYQVLESASG